MPEAAVVIVAPTLELPEGASAGEVVLGGTGTPGSELAILVDGVAVGTVTVNDDGNLGSCRIELAAGSREIVVQALGEDGSVAAASEAQQLEVAAPTLGEGTAPVAVSIDQPQSGATVANAPITLGGTGTPGSTIEILTGDQVVGTVTVGDDGRWSFEVTPDGPGEISYSVREAGSTAVSAPVAITVADVTPATPGDSVVIAFPAEGDELPVGPFTMSGTGPPGTSWEVLNSDQVLGTVTVGDDGTWSLDVTPVEGTASYSVRPVGASEIVGTPVRVTVGEATAACDAIAVTCEVWVSREGGRTLRLRSSPGVSSETLELPCQLARKGLSWRARRRSMVSPGGACAQWAVTRAGAHRKPA
ncbi:hypothetical protein HC891_18040 [Candidatus Gracilibacteria bacterium]|nr:hypothetical protein [Candidatus Gracilibacteria bacterium]